ncbi:MAG: RagB/SusD family nutrient uptake outer membrane protein, partial [Bacteroidales bacterium]|nr:RagB/SusD family nutrient uptake outer membrane protein [Bacteroidales bacterium]
NKAEAAKNYQDIFETPSMAWDEIIFMKAYIDGAVTGQQGHDTDFWLYPQQCKFHNLYMSSRFGATLDIVDLYEDYTDDGTGKSAPVKTRTDGIEDDFISDPKNLTSLTQPFIHYDNQYDIFKDKDARLQASVILPGSIFQGTLINMQGGL